MEGKDKEVAAERKKLEGLQKKLKEVCTPLSAIFQA